MNRVSIEELNKFVNSNIDEFHNSKIRCLQDHSLDHLLRCKNPYLFRAKNINSANDLVQELLLATLSSSEEKLFGDFLEKLAIFISGKTCGGKKSSASGIDLEFENNMVYYAVSIKSGVNWGNSSQHKAQEENFKHAVTVLKQNNINKIVEPVLGICYGKTKETKAGGYLKVVGQSFWYLLSNKKNLYTDIIEPLGYKAKEHTDKFLIEKDRIVNIFTQEFLDKYCDAGIINWKKLVQFNSRNIRSK